MTKHFEFRCNNLHFNFRHSPDEPVKALLNRGNGQWSDNLSKCARLVELQANGFDQNAHHGNNYAGTNPAGLLRYESHRSSTTELGKYLEIKQTGGGLSVTSCFQFLRKLPAFRSWTTVENVGSESVTIEYVSSFAIKGVSQGGLKSWDAKMRLHVADNSWCGECQWRSGNVKDFGLTRTTSSRHSYGYSMKRVTGGSQGSWSCSDFLPMGALVNEETDQTLLWQIDHNGSWHWEITDTADEIGLLVSGPTYREGLWSRKLLSGQVFESVPVTMVDTAGDLEAGLQILTKARRLKRREHKDLKTLPVIFNDYMNCLSGDPTAEKLVPVINGAAEVGCEYFVIDAGWYAEIGETWWDAVGLWQPSKSRFPEGLGSIVELIRQKGMIPGLWLEIEVMGVRCPLASQVPDSWFFQRNKQRTFDNGRYQLDFRNPKVRAHAHQIVSRLIADFGIGYIKMDYNINAGPGTDWKADSAGDGLLEHNRAYLRWIGEVFDAHPGLIIENCGSGGLRMDYAQLSIHNLQSITDQSDYRLNAVIAAACPSAVTPEQAAIWSYPVKESDSEETIFNMINAILLRIHQSGRIDEVSNTNLDLIREGISLHKSIRKHLHKGLPFWPLGLPRLDAGWTALGLDCGHTAYLAVWRLSGKNSHQEIPLPSTWKAGAVEIIYPETAAAGSVDAKSFRVALNRPYMARLFRIIK